MNNFINQEVLLGKYYNQFLDKFTIPINKVQGDIINSVLSLMDSGYYLGAESNLNGLDYYMLSKISSDCEDLSELSSESLGVLFSSLRSGFDCHLFSKISIENFIRKSLYHGAVDYILIDGTDSLKRINGKSFILVKEDGMLVFKTMKYREKEYTR